MLNINIGTYTHHVNSMHFYEKDRQKIVKASEVENPEENIMAEMPKENIEYQINRLIKMEEKLRKNLEIYDENQDDYFQFLINELIKYNRKKYA